MSYANKTHFDNRWLCTWPRFEKESFWNSEMAHSSYRLLFKDFSQLTSQLFPPRILLLARIFWVSLSEMKVYMQTSLTTYHLRGKTRHSGWKIKWFAPFRLGSFTEKYGLWFAANPAIFPLFLVCLDDLDIFCSGSFSHHVKFQSFIQLFGERLSDKVHATTLKGIVGGLSALFFKEIWKNGSRGHGHMSVSAKGKQ